MIDELPKIVKTLPSDNEKEIDTNLKEITIQFSKSMSEGYEFISVYDEIDFRDGQWKDKKTFVVPVRNELKSRREYIIFLNSTNKLLFRDTNNNPLVPCSLKFTTK